MSTSFLSIRAIRKQYGAVTAVADVSLDVARGEFVTFLGPSGSGKSTTLYVVAGLMEPSGGEVLLEGRSLLGVPPNLRNIGMVFQRYTLFPHLTVAENIAFPLRVRRRPRAEIAARVDAMLRLVRLDGMRDRRPAQLSGGQQQRVALARALAYDPPILLMDEPLSALDKKLREDMQAEIRRVHTETGVTILYVTHDQEKALRLSDRIALFDQGRIAQLGTGRELYDRPRSMFVSSFIGNSNFLPVRVTASSGGTASICCPDGFTLEGVPVAGSGGTGEPALMVRPERIRLDTNPGTAGIGAVVTDAAFLGESIFYTLRTDWAQKIAVRTSLAGEPSRAAAIGDTVRISWKSENACLFVP